MEGDASECEHLRGKYNGTSPGLDALWSRLKQADIGRDRCCVTWRWTVNDRAAHPRCPMVAPPGVVVDPPPSSEARPEAVASSTTSKVPPPPGPEPAKRSRVTYTGFAGTDEELLREGSPTLPRAPAAPVCPPVQLQDTSMQSMIETKDAWATYLKSLEELLEELTAPEASATDPNVNRDRKADRCIEKPLVPGFEPTEHSSVLARGQAGSRTTTNLGRQRGDFHLAERDPESSYFHVCCDGEQYEPSFTSGDNHQGVPHHVGGGRVQVLRARQLRLPLRHEVSR